MSMSKRNISIRFKLFLQVGAILLIAILAFLSINYWYLGDIYITNEKQNMAEIADKINSLDFSSEDYKTAIKSFESESGITIDIYSNDGSTLYLSSNTFGSTSGRLTVLSREESSDGSFFEIQQIENSDLQYIVYCKPLSIGGEIEMFSRKSTIDANTNIALSFMGYTAIFAVLLTAGFIFLYSGRFTKPLIQMSEITKKMSEMNFSKKVSVNRRDEIGTLAKSINDLSDSLDTTLQDLNDKNARLLNDIEQEKKLEQIRKSFVSNVSHELKTPISIIQGYAEGLKLMVDSGDAENANSYCDIIMNETCKMNALVLQLLELSLYESGGEQLNEEAFNIFELVYEHNSSLKFVLEENGIQFKVDIDKSFVGFADKVKMNMVINNYISNAISHTSGEKEIVVSCEDTGEYYRLFVFNTGNNIPQTDIYNIWQSFYRADKSRNRKEGRFGLGLSIVSAICNLHNTKYGAENLENGVRFFVDIKKG